MNQIKIDPSQFTKEHPNEEGLFLWKSSSDVQLIKVYLVPTKDAHGIKWRSHYAVAGHRGRCVDNFRGTFLKVTLSE